MAWLVANSNRETEEAEPRLWIQRKSEGWGVRFKFQTLDRSKEASSRWRGHRAVGGGLKPQPSERRHHDCDVNSRAGGRFEFFVAVLRGLRVWKKVACMNSAGLNPTGGCGRPQGEAPIFRPGMKPCRLHCVLLWLRARAWRAPGWTFHWFSFEKFLIANWQWCYAMGAGLQDERNISIGSPKYIQWRSNAQSPILRIFAIEFVKNSAIFVFSTQICVRNRVCMMQGMLVSQDTDFAEWLNIYVHTHIYYHLYIV